MTNSQPLVTPSGGNPGSRRPRFRRSPSGRIQSPNELDVAIFKLLARTRFLSTEEIATLLDGQRNRAYLQQRLADLFHNAWLDRPGAQRLLQQVKGTTNLIYALGPKGAQAMGEPIKKNDEIKSDGLVHDHMAGTLFTRAHVSIRDCPGVEITAWVREPRDSSVWVYEAGSTVPVRADARFTLTRDGGHRFFFVEAETGKVPGRRKDFEQSSFYKKILTYTALWRQWQETAKRDPSHPPDFRVLTILPAAKEQHLQYLRWLCRAADSLKSQGLGIFWFSYVELVEQKNVFRDAIWVKPSDDPKHPDPYSIL